jgi:hypothetical protein
MSNKVPASLETISDQVEQLAAAVASIKIDKLDSIHAKLDRILTAPAAQGGKVDLSEIHDTLAEILEHVKPKEVIELPALHPTKRGTPDYEAHRMALQAIRRGQSGFSEAQAELREAGF